MLILSSPSRGLTHQDIALLEQSVIEQSRHNSAIFTQYVFEYKNRPFHDSWHQFMDTHRYGEILAYRGSGKSEQITIPRTCWEVGRNPNIRIKIATESDDLAAKLLSKIGDTLLDNERYHKVFPHIHKSKRHAWNSKKLHVERTKHLKDPTVEATGLLTARTGGRADLIFFDDIVGLRNSLLIPKMRFVVKQAFYSNWLNFRDDPKSFRWFLVGTPWHIDDVVTDLRNNPAIPKCAEVSVGPNFESPWPERHSSEYFQEQMQIMHRVHFNRAYRLIALDDSEAWVNVASLMNARDMDLSPQTLIANKEVPKFTGVDLGHRSGEEHCPSVIFTIAMLPGNIRVPVDIRISHDAGPLSIVKVIGNVIEQCDPSIVMVENVAAQAYMVDLVKQLGGGSTRIEGYFTTSGKFDPDTGLPSMFAEIENGKWRIPLGMGGAHDDACQCHFCRWMNELRDYPNGKTDTVMAAWLALQGLRKLKERANSGGGFSLWSLGN